MRIRLATAEDLPALKALIPLSARALSRGYYSEEQTEGAIRHVFGPDTQLITDGTYLVAKAEGRIIGCGGWSRRRTLFGSDDRADRDESWLDPHSEAAKIRAFFQAPTVRYAA